MARTAAYFVALLATALMLGPTLAHLFELRVKIGLSRDQYFTVQQIYAGWDRFAVLLVVQALGIVSVIFLERGKPPMWPALGALATLVAAQILFWIYTYPANVATSNWTRIPENWDGLRHQWEYSHAAGAAFQLMAMVCMAIAALSRDR